MKKFRRYILAGVLAAGVLAAGCSHDEVPAAADCNNGTVTIPVTVVFPDMEYATTRALSDKPVSGSLDIWLLVFDQAGLSETVTIENLNIDQDPSTRKATFKLELAETEPDAEIAVHIIAAEKNPTGKDFLKDQLQGNWGPEDFVMQGLTTSGGEGAYWNRVDLKCAISESKKDEIAEKFKHVDLVRNFARVSIANDASNFTISGFTVVNVPDAGAVVPIFYKNDSSPAQYADFVTAYTTDHNDNYYNAVTAQGYTGRMPANATLQTPDYTNLTPPRDKFYFYERPFSATDHTYVIMKGTYMPTSPTKKETYYKIDLGSTDATTGLFTYYNLLRNIDYHIVIKSVEANGADDPGSLANAAASNNLCAAIETISQSTISDGTAKIEVSTTTVVIVDKEPVTMRFRYAADMKTGTYNNAKVDMTTLVDPDEILESVTISGSDDDEEDHWRTITIKPKGLPVDVLRQANFTLYYAGGLSRLITVVQRQPWEFGKVEAKTETSGKITVSVELPAGLPESMFPLSITFEDGNGEVLETLKVQKTEYKNSTDNTFSKTFPKPEGLGSTLNVCNPYFTNNNVEIK